MRNLYHHNHYHLASTGTSSSSSSLSLSSSSSSASSFHRYRYRQLRPLLLPLQLRMRMRMRMMIIMIMLSILLTIPTIATATAMSGATTRTSILPYTTSSRSSSSSDHRHLQQQPQNDNNMNDAVVSSQSSPSKSITFLVTSATILSGGLTQCQTVTDTSCRGGSALVMALLRKYTNNSQTDIASLILPKLDYQSPFVQMHPLSWSVNRLVYKDHYNISVYWAQQSLLSQNKEQDNINSIGTRDLSDLQTTEFQPLISNIAVPSSNSWSQYVKHIYLDPITNLAIITALEKETGYGISFLQSCKGLLRYIYQRNQRSGCYYNEQEEEEESTLTLLTPYLSYMTEKYPNRTIQPKQCWIPIVITSSSIVNDFDVDLIQPLVYDYEYPPSIIIDQEGDQEKYNTKPIQLVNSSTFVYSGDYSNSNSFHLLRFELSHSSSSSSTSSSQSSIINVTVIQHNMRQIPMDIIQNDTIFQSDILYMRSLAEEASWNDPVVGMSQVMPETRNGTLRACMGGECPIGNLYTDAMKWKVNADIAFINSGGIRGPGWPRGSVQISNIWNALPFANQLCDATLTGLSIFRIFNFSTSLATFNSHFTENGDRLLQVSGAKITYNTKWNSSRLISIDIWNNDIKEYEPLQRLKLYKVASGSWECFGFHPIPNMLSSITLTIPGERPATIRDFLLQNIVGEYLTEYHSNTTTRTPEQDDDKDNDDDYYYDTSYQGRLVNITDDPSLIQPMDWIQTEDTCPIRTYWVNDLLTCFDCPSMTNVKFSNPIVEATGVSGTNDPIFLEASIQNMELFPITLLPKTIPSWISWYVTEGGGSTSEGSSGGVGLDDEGSSSSIGQEVDDDVSSNANSLLLQVTLEPNEIHTYFFAASAVDVKAGIAQATVSFALQDGGGTYYGCSGDDVTFEVYLQVAPPPELNKPEQIRYVGYTVMTIVCFTSLGLAIWVYFNQSQRVVKSRQPEFLITLCIGFMILALSILPLSVMDELSSSHGRNRACMAVPWLVTIGFNMVMLALYAKLWRLNKLLNNAARFARVTVTARHAVVACGIVFAINVILLILWTILDPLEWEIEHVPGEEWNRYGSCNGHGNVGVIFFALVSCTTAISLLVTGYQAFQARNISDEYSESKALGIAVFSSTQIAIVGCPLLFLISKDNPDATYLVQVMMIFGICMSGLLLIFIPVIRQPNGGDQSRPNSIIRDSRTQPGSVVVYTSGLDPRTSNNRDKSSSRAGGGGGDDDTNSPSTNETALPVVVDAAAEENHTRKPVQLSTYKERLKGVSSKSSSSDESDDSIGSVSIEHAPPVVLNEQNVWVRDNNAAADTADTVTTAVAGAVEEEP